MADVGMAEAQFDVSPLRNDYQAAPSSYNQAGTPSLPEATRGDFKDEASHTLPMLASAEHEPRTTVVLPTSAPSAWGDGITSSYGHKEIGLALSNWIVASEKRETPVKDRKHTKVPGTQDSVAPGSARPAVQKGLLSRVALCVQTFGCPGEALQLSPVPGVRGEPPDSAKRLS
ncbi:hypothetical protein E5288_WYG003998 [Bos mutus]|uniref:Uncharacterized protein n=1 Tax=Bos mutus TaxID=72004 RepID=A0A6B0SDC0_9CETA|nr:hypothetical protein [Bos mutus]